MVLTLIHIGMTLSIFCFYTGYYFRFKKIFSIVFSIYSVRLST
ncbi:hypothetical protein LEP1GSC188_2941 [Leptospira weilii serovar Topaz str. LT2116]|uniref:Uncharacterized protein n=1 Tax=Leptospira weilii serovar Topaz str. LT2116 TaxID=1088540 RepID=M3H0R3_9LEPT|nr:hypothetical protein LEP1GSC188_2941 [Leptospira weilii serovar Topaz str. LT2116]